MTMGMLFIGGYKTETTWLPSIGMLFIGASSGFCSRSGFR